MPLRDVNIDIFGNNINIIGNTCTINIIENSLNIIGKNKRPLGLKAPLSNNTLSMVHSSMNTKLP